MVSRNVSTAVTDLSVTGETKHACVDKTTVHVAAKAANLSERILGTGPDADIRRFDSWTKRLCGVSPEALSHMQHNSVGCDAPENVPASRRDLRWYSSAVAGKMRASSHSPLAPEATNASVKLWGWTTWNLQLMGRSSMDMDSSTTTRFQRRCMFIAPGMRNTRHRACYGI